MPIIVVPENQLGYFHKRIEERFSRISDTYVIFQNGGSKPGIAKSAHITSDYVIRTRSAMHHGSIMFDEDWITVTGHIKDRTRAGVLREFKQQLMRFGYDEKKRLNGKRGGHQDDGAVAFMMFIYWAAAVERPHEGNPYLLQFPFLRMSMGRR